MRAHVPFDAYLTNVSNHYGPTPISVVLSPYVAPEDVVSLETVRVAFLEVVYSHSPERSDRSTFTTDRTTVVN